METQGYIGDMTRQITSFYESNMSSVESRFQGVADTLEKAVGTITTPDGRVLTPYDPANDDSNFGKLYNAWTKYYGSIDNNVEEIREKLSQYLVIEHSQQMMSSVNQITNNSNVNNTANKNVQPIVNQEIHVTLPNVTNSTAAETLLKDLESLSTKRMQINW